MRELSCHWKIPVLCIFVYCSTAPNVWQTHRIALLITSFLLSELLFTIEMSLSARVNSQSYRKSKIHWAANILLYSLVTLGKTEVAKRKISRSRMVPLTGGLQSINKASNSAPVPGDLADTGPKEPPILVTPSESFRYPLDPCFVFLQLYHASFLGPMHEKPQPLPDGEVSYFYSRNTAHTCFGKL